MLLEDEEALLETDKLQVSEKSNRSKPCFQGIKEVEGGVSED